MNKIAAKRYFWLDLAKFIGIFSVLIIHNPLIPDDLRTVLQSCAMSLFFILSGYLYKTQPLTNGVKRDFISLIIPFYIFNFAGLLYIYAGSILQHGIVINPSEVWFMTHEILLGRLRTMTAGMMGVTVSTWFLYALFCVKAINYLLDYSKSNLVMILVALFSVACGYLLKSTGHEIMLFQFNSALMAIPFFVVGRFLRKYDMLTQVFALQIYYKIPIIICVYLLVAFTALYNEHIDLFASDWSKNLFIYYFDEFFGSFAIILFCSLFRKYQSKFVTTIANGLVLLLGTNIILIKNFYNFYSYFQIPYSPLIPVVTALGVIVIHYPIILFCEKYCPLLIGRGFLKIESL